MSIVPFSALASIHVELDSAHLGNLPRVVFPSSNPGIGHESHLGDEKLGIQRHAQLGTPPNVTSSPDMTKSALGIHLGSADVELMTTMAHSAWRGGEVRMRSREKLNLRSGVYFL
jgi:hypothetical protein